MFDYKASINFNVSFFQNISSVYKVTGLQNGSNKVAITTAHYPESEVSTFYFN